MFKRIHNIMKINLRVQPQTPLLVASGKSFNVTRPDIEFIRVNTPYGETPYLPGSSVKGVLRAGMEMILGESINYADKICLASEKMCPEKHEEKQDSNKKVSYRYHCPVCRLFGSGQLASRLEISDLFPYMPEESSEIKSQKINTLQQMISTRPGILIDRKSGKTKGGALFNYEILGGGEFYGQMTLTNYQLVQPGLLFTLFDLANEGILRFGHSKSRGLGIISFIIDSITVMQMGQLRGEILKGIGDLKKYQDYDLYTGERDTIDKPYTQWYGNQTLYSLLTFDDANVIRDVTGQIKNKISTFLG